MNSISFPKVLLGCCVFTNSDLSEQKLDPPADSDTLRNASSSHEANLADNSIKSVIIPSDSHIMLTGGSDRKIRFWDMTRVENSTVVLGLEPEEPRPRYRYDSCLKTE
jgi:phosphoinositide-3-kinase regulatory subunit 4